MNRARTRVLVAPEWSSNIPSTSGAVNTEVSLKERLSHLVSAGVAPHAEDRATNGLEVAKAAPTCTRNDSLQPGSAAVAPSPVPEPASSTAVPPQVLYPPPIPPYIALRSAWPEAALLDLVKQQALYPTDVNVRIGQPWMGAEPAGPPQSRLLHAVSNESQANIVATPASASSQLLRLLAEVCSRSCSSSSNPSFSGCGSNTSNSGGAVAAGGGGAIPPPPPDLAPALTLAAAAAATAAVPACPPGHSEVVLPPLEATQLPTPAALVGFQGEWLAVQPQVLRCWDKVSLEPCGPPKAAHFYLLCPEQHASAARMFVKDLSATFLAMRLGTHSAGRTLAHLHSIDGVVPVPLDPGPGPPPLSSTSTADGGGSEGNAAAGGGGAAPPAPTWHPLGRRPDRAVLRSAVLGFRSNHAAASVAGEAGWAAPDEPCYRPRRGPQGSSRQQQQQQPQVHGVMPFQSLSQQVPAVALQQQQQPAGVFGSGIPFPNRAGVAGQQQQGPHQHYWRNLRHVSRQLQRQMLLAATAAPLRSSATAVAPPLSLPHPPPSCGGGGPQQHQQQSRPDQHHQQQQLGLGAPALVVYVVPPSDSPEDVARALLEVAAALAPVTPAARAPPAAAALPPLVVPPGSAGVAAGGAACGGGSSRSGQGIASVHGTHSQDGRAVGWGGGASVSGSNGCMGGVASGVVGLGRGKDSSSGRQQQAGSSRASTPPEPPAPAAAAAAAHGAATTGSTVACTAAGAAAAGAASVRDADAGDPALLERLGGAARHLYRTTTTTNTPAMTPGATNSSSSHQDPQLDPASLPSTELVLQLVLPSTLHDISGASVRATACAAYSKLIRRRAAYGAAVAAVGSAGPTSGISGISGGFAAAPDAAAAGRGTLSSLSSCCNGNAASCCGSSDCRKRGSCSVLSSCSGCCSLYEPLVALAPQLQLQQQQQHPLPQPPPAAALPPPPPPPPTATLFPPPARSPSAVWEAAAGGGSGGGVGEDFRTTRAYSSSSFLEQLGHAGRVASSPPPLPLPQRQQQQREEEDDGKQQQHQQQQQQSAQGLLPPTLHCCYTWQRCTHTSPLQPWSSAAFEEDGEEEEEGSGGPEGREQQVPAPSLHPHPSAVGVRLGQQHPKKQLRQRQQRCWLAMAFCDGEGRMLDARVLALSAALPDTSGTSPAAATARPPTSSSLPPLPQLTAPQRPCSCGGGRSGGSGGLASGGGGSGSTAAPTPAACTCGGAASPLDDGAAPRGGGGPMTAAAAAAGASLAVAVTAAEAADPLATAVCAAVLGHARLLHRQLSTAVAAAAEAAKAGAATASATVGAAGGNGVIAVTRLGRPATAEAAAWQALLLQQQKHMQTTTTTKEALHGGSCASSITATATVTAAGVVPEVTLAWLDPHPPVAVQPGCRLPHGGFVLRYASSGQQQQQVQQTRQQQGGLVEGAVGPCPVTLVTFPMQLPASTTCVATESLNRQLRMLSVHPFPPAPPLHPTSSTAAAAAMSLPGTLKRTHGSLEALGDGVDADDVGGGVLSEAEGRAEGHTHKKRRWDVGNDSAVVLTADCDGGGSMNTNNNDDASDLIAGGGSGGSNTSNNLGGWSGSSGWDAVRGLYGLCVLRDCLLAAQSGSRGGPAPGSWRGGAVGDGSGETAEDDALLLPLHAAVCQRLLRLMTTCEQLARA